MQKIFTIFFLIFFSFSNFSLAKDASNFVKTSSLQKQKTYKFSRKKCLYEESNSYQTLAVFKCKNKYTNYKAHPKPAPVKKAVIRPQPVKKPQIIVKKRKIVKPARKVTKNNNKYVVKRKSKEKSHSANRTQGHYLGVDALYSNLSFYERYSETGVPWTNKTPPSQDQGVSWGINYKYAFNVNKLFVAPGIFYDHYTVKTRDALNEDTVIGYDYAANHTSLAIKKRYGFTSDIGYDLYGSFSPYFILGYSWIDYLSQNGGCLSSNCQSKLQNGISQANTGRFLYGLGLKVNYNKSLSFNIRGDVQKFVAKTNSDVEANKGYNYEAVFRAKLKTLKVGMAYNF